MRSATRHVRAWLLGLSEPARGVVYGIAMTALVWALLVLTGALRWTVYDGGTVALLVGVPCAIFGVRGDPHGERAGSRRSP